MNLLHTSFVWSTKYFKNLLAMNFAAHHSLHHSSLSLPTLVLLGHCLVPEGNVCVCVCVCVCVRARAHVHACVCCCLKWDQVPTDFTPYLLT